jgi:hypothetical protein
MAVSRASTTCSTQELATLENALAIVCISGVLITQLLTMVWIALLLAVVVPNNGTFKSLFSQMQWVVNAHQVLKPSLATPCAAQLTAWFLSMTALLTNASQPSSVLPSVTLVSAHEQELLLLPRLAVVLHALLWLIGFLARFETVM